MQIDGLRCEVGAGGFVESELAILAVLILTLPRIATLIEKANVDGVLVPIGAGVDLTMVWGFDSPDANDLDLQLEHTAQMVGSQVAEFEIRLVTNTNDVRRHFDGW